MKPSILLVLLAFGCDAPPPPPVSQTSKHPVVHNPITPPTYFIGVVTAAQLVDIAPRVDGVILRMTTQVGEHVVREQILAEMDPLPMREEIQIAQASLAAAKAARRQAEINVEDAQRKLAIETQAVAAGVSPSQLLSDNEFAKKRADASRASAIATEATEAARLRIAIEHLNNATLRAPFDGDVILKFHDTGSTIAANTPIIRLVGKGGLRLRFAVPPKVASSLKPGMMVSAQIETLNDPAPATISQVAPGVDATSGLVLVDAQFKVDSQPRLGLAAKVTIANTQP